MRGNNQELEIMSNEKTLYYFDFDANKWLSISSKVQLLTHEQKGIFIDLIAMCLINNGQIKNDKLLASKLKQTQANLSKSLECFQELEILVEKDGFLRIKFISEKFDRINRIKQQRIEAGRKGGKAKAGKSGTSYNKNNNNNNKKENLLKERDTESTISVNYSQENQKIITQAAERISRKHPRLKEPPKTTCLIVTAIHDETENGRSLEQAIEYIENKTEQYAGATGNWPIDQKQYIVSSTNWYKNGGYLENPDEWIKDNRENKYEVRDGWLWINGRKSSFTGAYDGLSFKNGQFTGHAEAVN